MALLFSNIWIMEKLLKFLNALAKPDQTAFALACGTTVGYLRKAASSNQLLNIPTCVAIERETKGTVSRIDLRPDDWAANWPELEVPANRRATDFQPAAGHPGRQPPSPHNILDTVPEGGVVSAIPTSND